MDNIKEDIGDFTTFNSGAYMKQNILEQIPQNIKKYRLLNKMTQADVALALNLDTQYYAQLERGERNFTVEKIILLCSVLNVEINNIIEIAPASNHATPATRMRINDLVNSLSESQLLLIEKIIYDIIPYT